MSTTEQSDQMPDPSGLKVVQLLVGSQEGGADTFFVKLCCALQEQGLHQKVVIGPNAERERQLLGCGCDVAVIRFGGLREVLARYRFHKLLGTYRPDIVLAWMNRAARRLIRGEFVNVARMGGYYPLKWYGKCDYLIGNTPGIVSHIVQSGFPKENAALISNFGEMPDFPRTDRKLLDTPEDVPVLLSLGRMSSEKGMDVLVRALARVPRAVLWLVGDGPLRDSLQMLASTERVSDRIRFLGWRYDVSALFKAADVCVVPSRHEPLGNVVLEAWMSGVPVVATKSEGPRWILEDGRTGILVPVDDADALATGIRKVLDDKALAASMATAARTDYSKRFSRDSVVAQYLNFFKKIVAEKKQQARDA